MNNITRKSIFMTGLKSKVGYVFNYKDLNEIEAIIDFYENKQNNLIKYLEDKIKFIEQPREYKDNFGYGAYTVYIDILERIKNNNYD